MLGLLGQACHLYKARKKEKNNNQGSGRDKLDETVRGTAGVALPRLTSASAHLPSSSSVSLVPIKPVNTHFFKLLYVLPLSITWPLRVVAMATPPTGAGYLPCYRSNWFPTEFQACHSVSLSLLHVISLPLSLSLSSHERVPICSFRLSILGKSLIAGLMVG